MLQCVAVYCSVLQCVALSCSVLQCVAVHYSALQCVAVRCSALQCVAGSNSYQKKARSERHLVKTTEEKHLPQSRLILVCIPGQCVPVNSHLQFLNENISNH